MPLVVELDHAQTRLWRDRIIALAGGDVFAGLLWQDTWIDPVTKTVFLRPAPLYDAWHTSGSGMNARLGLTDFGLTADVDGWKTNPVKYVGQNRLYNTAPMAASVLSTTSYDANRAFYVAYYGYGTSDEDRVLLDFGWSDTGDGLAGVSIRARLGGDIEVWKDGAMVGGGAIKGRSTGSSTGNEYTALILMPCRGRELLVYSPSHGSGFTHVFEDIAEDEASPIITPAAKVWFQMYTTVDIEVAPIQFVGTGYVTSLQGELTMPPATGSTPEAWPAPSPIATGNCRIFGDGPGTATASLVNYDGTAFVPNDTRVAALLRVDLTGSATATPSVYGAVVSFTSEVTDTNATEQVTVTDWIVSASLSVPESPSGVEASLTFKDPLNVPAANLPDQNNRPVRLTLDGSVLLDGRNETPSGGRTISDEATRLSMTVRDQWKAIETYRFLDQFALDGLTLEDALQLILSAVGYGSYDMEVSGVIIGEAAPKECGEWSTTINVGDTAAQWIQQLVEDNAGSWFYGFIPGGVFKFCSPDSLDAQASLAVVYLTDEEAIANGVPHEEIPFWVAQKFDSQRMAILGNEVRIVGQDPRTRRSFQVYKQDVSSADPELAPSARPVNWYGEPVRSWTASPSFATISQGEAAADLALERDASSPVTVELTCQYIPGSWRGSKIEVYGYGFVIIESMVIDFDLESDDDGTWRPTRYTGRKIE